MERDIMKDTLSVSNPKNKFTENNNVEPKLDEADRLSELTYNRLTHDKVFGKLRSPGK